MEIKTVACDDVEKARYIIKEYLKVIGIKEFKFIGEFNDGTSLLNYCKNNPVDLVFLDIELPDMNGLLVAENLIKINPAIRIIITTAYANFALEAHSVHPIDFLIKPLDIERMKKTLEYILRKLRATSSDIEDVIKIEISGETYIVKQDSIFFIETLNRKVIIHAEDRDYEINESLEALEKRLNKDIFFRSHRGFIVNLNKINRIGKNIGTLNSSKEIFFKNYDKSACVSHSFLDKLEELMSKYA